MGSTPKYLLFCLLACATALPGCHLMLADVTHVPVVHNPFPQLSRVAVVPFFNQTDQATVDGRQFAMAYFAELQSIPGYEVVPVGVVEEAIVAGTIDLSDPAKAADEARRLAKSLGVDAVVIGAVTDYTPYYPPRCGLRIEWYAANPGFHPIPAGYGLPWGTPDEEYIPDALVFEAEMALAREQMATQSPECGPMTEGCTARTEVEPGLAEPSAGPSLGSPAPGEGSMPAPLPDEANQPEPLPAPEPSETEQSEIEPSEAEGEQATQPEEAGDAEAGAEGGAKTTSYQIATGEETLNGGVATGATEVTGAIDITGGAPAGWPDARGFTPAGPSSVRPPCIPQNGPVMTHTRVFQGHDPDFTAALAGYVSYRDDARFGGWQSYLERSDDFIRFCCHLHLQEMLSARGGGGETRVVRRWSERR